ncbi:MAG: hypothetical protein PHR39_07555, partial [Actinomycetota bacterium]|nr:hypothetical protein [Actinomycetota bacterium]
MIFNTAMLSVLSLIFSFVLSMILVRISITLLSLLGLLDQPGGRYIHTKPTPKGGGLAFILAFFITGVFFNLSQTIILPGTMDLAFMGKIALPVVLLTVIGFLD